MINRIFTLFLDRSSFYDSFPYKVATLVLKNRPQKSDISRELMTTDDSAAAIGEIWTCLFQ